MTRHASDNKVDNMMGRLLYEIGDMITGFWRRLCVSFLSSVYKIGETTALFLSILKRFPYSVMNPDLTIRQMVLIGTSSLPLVLTTSFFTGAVAAVSLAYQFRGFIPMKYLGTGVAKTVIIETGPVLTGLVLAGRVGSAIAAEIGTMKEKEELDAMVVLNLDPLRYLALPRLLSGMIIFPILMILADAVAIFGGWLVSITSVGITSETYIRGLRFLFSGYDLVISLFKAMVFGIIVVLMGYWNGLKSEPGARGVGRAAMKSVVACCVLILIFDFLIIYVAY